MQSSKDLEQAAGSLLYLEDMIVFDSNPMANIEISRALFERLRRRNPKLSLLKVRLGATDADCLGHSILPTDLGPIAEKVSTLSRMPISPRGLKPFRSLVGSLAQYREFLLAMFKRTRPISSLLEKGIIFKPSMQAIVLKNTRRDLRPTHLP